MRKNTVFVNERGSVFIITLLLIVLISVISFALITMTSNTLKITKHERTDQSVFYIAEADLNIKRADINSELEGVFQSILDGYKDKELDLDKINGDYLSAAVSHLNKKLIFDPTTNKKEYKYAEVKSYKHQNGHEPASQVILKEGPESNSYTLESTADIDGITRTISQTFSIKLPDILTEPGDETPTNYNFCFGVLVNSFEATNTYYTNADIFALNDLKIKNGGEYYNIYSKGSITLTNTPTVYGDLVALSDITFESGGTYKKDIISNEDIYFKTQNGYFTSTGNFFALNDILIGKNINTVSNTFMYSNKNIINQTNTYPTIKGVIFGKESIQSLTDSASALGSKRYSIGEIVYKKGNNTTNIRAKDEAEFNQFLSNENINLNYYHEKLNKLRGTQDTSGNTDDCSSQSFANAQIPSAPKFLNIVDDSLLTELSSISTGANNSISLLNDSYIPNISIRSNATLTIDVGDQDRTLVIDDLTSSGGNIRIKGTGKLNILVRNKLSIVDFLASNERTPFDTTIYYEGASPLSFSKKVESNLYTKYSSVSLSSAHISGNLIVGGVLNNSGDTKFGNEDHHIVILAPNSSIKFGGSSTIFGTIIGNKVDTIGANTKHIYDKNKLNTDIFAPTSGPTYSTEGGLIDPEPQKEI
ncbi:hypothetical protein AEA09_12645 [Lysinibacillus contaminans]|uniref:Type 4 fimbrial biogenesis protein PilX N-terminal domain-containing protein n=1 Tax=Lysinibacillus contaminans TaxID=1293441 RepID=A0ABR5K3H6_9BACI|nr:PilX N-terminal domain-containing pilus assembly protein [Lysinibacillus contaminans]KOS69324.1 hypothetical protein AEA09_12645 [Lysinibacillus contaminans]